MNSRTLGYTLILALIAGAPVQPAAGADREGNFAVWGVGARSCHAFNQAAEAGDTDEHRQYVMGYLTAYNALVEDTYRIEGSMDLDEIMAWLGNYCEAKPINAFEQALGDFTAQHVSTRSRQSSPRGPGQ